MTAAHIPEPARDLPVRGEYDVVVLGGGPAGIAAAATAAAHGRKTLLVERYGFLGGMGTAAGVTNFCGLHANVHGEIRQVVHGVADELLARIDRLGGLNAPHMVFGKIAAQAYDTAAYKCAADDLLLGKGVDILFHALGAGVAMEADGAIRALIVETKSGRAAIVGRVFIDCSGDGDLAAWAGAPFELGDGQGSMLYPTLMFRLNGVDPDAAGEAWKSIPALMEDAERRGMHFPRKGAIVRPQKNAAEWRVNVTQMKSPNGRALDGTDAGELSLGEIEGRRQALAFAEFLKREAPGFAQSYIVDIPPQIGIRETRRVTGAYRLTGEDVLSCASFADTVGVNGWPIEKHIAGDVEWLWPAIPQSRGYNHLPFRMLLPQSVRNLLVAGRCASMTHDGQSAARVSGACFVMGQAAGSAAHLALSGSGDPAQISVEALQRLLENGGAYLGRDAP
ncbi:MAG: FAD-dependent oxidoreductase [Alphaproteobacteria bacterium]|nr:FAD-dependent oxidoreductase [Alphaproteobacteria bacterium]